MSEHTDIGQQLLKARELKNLTCKDIEQSTRIPSATIAALESNDYSALPTSYARSFLAQYSEYLQIDASELLDSLVPDEDITNIGYLKKNQDTISEKRGSSPKARSNRKRKKGLNQLQSSSGHPDGKKMAQPLAILGLALLLIIGISLFFKNYGSQPSSEAKNTADAREASAEQRQGELTKKSALSSSADQKNNLQEDVVDLFDPISTPENRLSPSPDSVSLEELAGLSDITSPIQNTENKLMAADTDILNLVESNDAEPTTQRNGPPPKAMVIDESGE
jgi:cytoskeletal protein RodZ